MSWQRFIFNLKHAERSEILKLGYLLSKLYFITKNIYKNTWPLTLTYWFSWILVPFTLSWQACESKSIVSTHKVSVVLTRELPTLPVEDSVCTFLLGISVHLHWAKSWHQVYCRFETINKYLCVSPYGWGSEAVTHLQQIVGVPHVFCLLRYEGHLTERENIEII